MAPTCNRRTFLAALGLSVPAASLPAEFARPSPSPLAPAPPALVFVPMLDPRSHVASATLRAWRIADGTCTELRPSFDSAPPLALTAHPSLPVLYSTGAPRGYLRRGGVTALRLDISLTGADTPHTLHELNHQALALAATHPRDLSVSPDGRHLVIADSAGGHLNLLPLAGDGALLPVSHVFKQTGFGPDAAQSSAQPHSVLFHPRLPLAYTTDMGADRLNLLSLGTGAGSQDPRIVGRIPFLPGSGPGHLALAPAARFLLVTSTLRRTLSVLPLDPETGAVSSTAISHLVLSGESTTGPAVLNSAGSLVYASSLHKGPSSTVLVSTLRLARSGRLSALGEQHIPRLRSVTAVALHGSHLLLAGDGGLVLLPLDRRTGLPSGPGRLVAHGNAAGLVLRRA